MATSIISGDKTVLGMLRTTKRVRSSKTQSCTLQSVKHVFSTEGEGGVMKTMLIAGYSLQRTSGWLWVGTRATRLPLCHSCYTTLCIGPVPCWNELLGLHPWTQVDSAMCSSMAACVASRATHTRWVSSRCVAAARMKHARAPFQSV
jgi:hypothetical protein